MNKNKKILIKVLNKKAEKLTNAIWKETKSNMYNKNIEKLRETTRKIEELRKKD